MPRGFDVAPKVVVAMPRGFDVARAARKMAAPHTRLTSLYSAAFMTVRR